MAFSALIYLSQSLRKFNHNHNVTKHASFALIRILRQFFNVKYVIMLTSALRIVT